MFSELDFCLIAQDNIYASIYFMSFFSKIFGDRHTKFIKTLEPVVMQIGSFEDSLKNLSSSSPFSNLSLNTFVLALSSVSERFFKLSSKEPICITTGSKVFMNFVCLSPKILLKNDIKYMIE